MIKYTAILATPFGNLGIETNAQELLNIDFLSDKEQNIAPQNDLSQKVCEQLENYFQNPHTIFSLDLNLSGTDFQKSVWNAMRQIPIGKTLTYGELAKQLKTSPRAVGNACRANPLVVIVPCHRIVEQKGLGGFAGDTTGRLIEIKKWLLQHEGVAC